MLSLKFSGNALLLGLLLLDLTSLSSSAAAQSTKAPASTAATQSPSPATSPASARSAPQSRGVYRRRTLDDRVKQLAKSLDLDEKQQAGLKGVLERQQLQARQIQFDPNISGEERIGRFRALQDDTVLRIRALLNDEQKKKYDPLNHGKQEAGSSDQYVDQWMKNHQRTAPHTPPAQK